MLCAIDKTNCIVGDKKYNTNGVENEEK